MGTVTLTPIPAPPVREQAIVIDGKPIGNAITITNSDHYKYHVTLIAKNICSLNYQGFGNTVDEAMRDAVEKNIKHRYMELAELDELENVIWGDHDLN